MNSTAGAGGNYRRGSVKAEKVISHDMFVPGLSHT